MYTISVPIEDYNRDTNEAFVRARIPYVGLKILLVWLGRHIVRDHYRGEDGSGSKWFGGNQDDGQFNFWFKEERDFERGKVLLI